MILIVGLGNPSAKYRGTRHNIGFMAVDYLSEANGIKLSKGDFKNRWGKGNIQGKEVIIAKPQTFMNVSGEAVKLVADYFRVEPKDIIAIYDDVDLEFGNIRIRPSGGSGGHKGMESIGEKLGTNNFPRIRLGIGRPKEQVQGDVADYVLSPFHAEEKTMLKQILEKTKDAMDVILRDGIEKAMNRFNKK